jgi:hypothetical protein
LQCANCGQWLEIAGRAATCPNCGKLVTVPVPVPPAPKRPLPDEIAAYEQARPYRPQEEEKRPLLPSWLKALLIIGGAGAFVFLLIQLAIWKVQEKVAGPATAPAPAPAPVAPAPPPPPANPNGSKLFSFDSSQSGQQQTTEVAPAPTPAPAPAPAPTSPPAATTTMAATSVAPFFKPESATPAEKTPVTDEAISAAIAKGADNLIKLFENGKIKGDASSGQYVGTDALCVLALLHAGQAISDERLNVKNAFLKTALDELRQMTIKDDYHTYTRSLRAQALAVYARREDATVLAADVRALVAASVKGSYTYKPPPAGTTQPEQVGWDNSNSQYGALGCWAAAEAGVPMPLSYWQDVQSHWERVQCKDGGWGYSPGDNTSTLSMTAAGVNMLFVANEQISAMRPDVQVARPPFSGSLQGGLDWLAKGNNAVTLTGMYPFYTLYGMERAGLACGFKMFGPHDWFRELAKQTLERQAPDGSWGHDYDTAFAILFLSRGRHPLLMNKLHYVGAWANRPRDVARLAKFVSKETERPLNWQVVSLSSDWTEWLDAPILYVASHEAPIFDDNDYAKLKQFVDAGGILFTNADGDSPEFNQWAEILALKLFKKDLQDLPPNHYVYNATFRPQERFPLKGVSNNTRLLMLHAPVDIAKRWHGANPKTDRGAFEFGANLFIYATGLQVPRNRLETLAIAEVSGAPKATIPVARLKYAGDWDPEPWAWTREARAFRRATSAALRPVPVDIEQLSTKVAPLAHLTGTSPFALTDAQVAALKSYVDAGGVLLIDATGGAEPVARSIRENVLARAFPGKEAAQIQTDHALLAGAGEGLVQIAKPAVRPLVLIQMQQKFPRFAILESGRGAVIVSELDLTSGLLGTNTLGILGYDPAYAQQFVQNLILWTVNGRPGRQPWNDPPATSTAPATAATSTTTTQP